MNRLKVPFADITDEDLTTLLSRCPNAWQGDQGFQNWCVDMVNLASGPASPPAIISIAPNTVAAGAPDTVITVTGTDFASGAVVVTSADLATTFLNHQTLTATIPLSQLAAAATIPVTVRNPDSQVSGALDFTVT